MRQGLIFRLLVCLVVSSFCFYKILQKQNLINYYSLHIPKVTKELKVLEEENLKLKFCIDQFESPDHLMQLVKSAPYAHLRFPVVKDVVHLPEGIALKQEGEDCQKSLRHYKTEPVLAVGAHP